MLGAANGEERQKQTAKVGTYGSDYFDIVLRFCFYPC